MSPHGKASVVRAIQLANPKTGTLMCGDGGNDVGALKQSDVGIALLAGHANTNTAGDITEGEAREEGSAEDALNAHSKSVMSKWEEVNKLRAAHMKQWQAEYQKQSQRRLQEETQALMARGEYMATFGAMKKNGLELRNAIQAENTRFMQLHGQVWDSKKDTSAAGEAGSLASLLDSPDEAAGGAPVVRPGDASVAAPFTSRVPSVRAAVDLIRQGRCTLLSALMQQQIMMLESTIAAYTMAALSLHNARSSERQMMASSWLIMTAAISFSYSTPLDKMHPLRPLRSLFHPAIILSVLGQAAIHIFCMSAAVQWATEEMGPAKLQEVTQFFKKAKAKEITMGCAEDDFMCQIQSFWEAPFMPNLLNTTVFLVETSQMISVFFANYKGRPWMKGMLDNHALFLSVFICIGGVAVASWEMSPRLNQLLQFAPFPDDAYRYRVIALVCASIVGTFAWDRLCTFLFARPVFKAMTAEVLRTTLTDMLPVIATAAKVRLRCASAARPCCAVA
jgi:cation-transporting ATPase 13A1